MSDQTLFDYLRWIVLHLGGWLLMLLPAYGIGRLCLRRVWFGSRSEQFVFSLTVGLGICGLLLFVMGLCGLLHRWVLVAGSATGSLITAFFLARSRHKADKLWAQWKTHTRRQRMLIAVVVMVAAGYWLALLLLTQYPPLQWDALEYHLTLSRDYLATHRLVVNTGVVYPVLPALNHMLFTWALALCDDVLAQMVQHTFMMLTALGLYAWGKRLKKEALGAAAAASWLAHPLVLWLGASAYVDVGVTALAFLGVYALRIFWDERETAWWFTAILLFSFTAGTKITVGPLFLIIGVGLGLFAWRTGKLGFKAMVWGIVLAVLVTAPWYAWIGYHTGNPVWPILSRFSRGMWGDPNVAAGLNVWVNVGVQKTILNFLLLPYYFISQKLFFPDNNRPLLPLMTLMPIAWVVMWKDRSVRWWMLWGLALTLYWFLSSQQIRLWLPALPFVTLAVCESLSVILSRRLKWIVWENRIWSAATLLAVVIGLLVAGVDIRSRRKLPVTPQARESFLSRLCIGYSGASYINQHAQADEAVYVVNGNWLIYHLRLRSLDMNAWLQLKFWPSFQSANDELWLKYLESERVNWILINYANAPEYLPIGRRNPYLNPIWPDFQLVFADAQTWVFRRKPVPTNITLKIDEALMCTPFENHAEEGFHDIADCRTIEGWVWDPKQPCSPVKVDIYADDMLLATLTADKLRPDLIRAGKGNGRHGFRLLLPGSLKDQQSHVIRVRVAGTAIELHNSAKTIRCQPK